MTRTEYENKTFKEVMEILVEEHDDITTREELKDFAKYNIDEDSLFLAIHILKAINNNYAEFYEYSYDMVTLQTPLGITEKEHVEHLLED